MKAKLEELQGVLEAHQAAVAREEAAIFGDFLAATACSSVADFEASFYNDRRAELEELDRLQKEREQLALKIADPADLTVLEANTALWAEKAAQEEARLVELKTAERDAREALRLKTSQVEAARDQVKAMEEARMEAAARAKTASSELEAAYRRRAERTHAMLAAQRAIRRLQKARYELFRTAYVEAVSLPVDREAFAELFAEQEDDGAADESVLEDATHLPVDYGAIKELLEKVQEEEKGGQGARDKHFANAVIKLEVELRELEEELKRVTIADDVNLTEE